MSLVVKETEEREVRDEEEEKEGRLPVLHQCQLPRHLPLCWKYAIDPSC